MKKVEKKNLLTALYCRLSVDDFDEKDKKKNKEELESNYVAYRGLYDRKKALELSVEAAMPTVFTSGLILTVCGFVIHFISSQNSISTVGLLLGIGTICSVIMITIVLPSVLYILDKFVLCLSLKKRKK